MAGHFSDGICCTGHSSPLPPIRPPLYVRGGLGTTPGTAKAKAIASAKDILGASGGLLKLPDIAVPTSLYERLLSKNWTLCSNEDGKGWHKGVCTNEHGVPRTLSPEAAAASEATLLKRDHNVVIVTGSSVQMLWNPWTRAMLSNKQAYAEAHGYGFELALSDLHVLTQDRMGAEFDRFKGEFVKVLMVWEAMVRNPDADWIVLTDHDMWFHPMALKNASLDLFLDTIPPHKLFAHANYHSLNTGVVLLRNSVLGRDLVLKWWSVLSSGLIECHAWDQAAAQFLMLYQLSGGDGGVGAKAAAESAADGSVTSRPFNYSCIKPHCGNFDLDEYWSCDKAFRDAIISVFTWKGWKG